MSDIDFLATNKRDDDQESKNKDEKKEKIVWSKPIIPKPAAKRTEFFSLPFLKKKAPAEPLAGAGQAIDKNKIRKSRREILRLIKYHQSSEAAEKNRKSAVKDAADAAPPASRGFGRATRRESALIKKGRSLLARLAEKLKKRSDSKEVLIDYQQAFNQNKIKKISPEIKAAKINLAETRREIKPEIVKAPRPVASGLPAEPPRPPDRQAGKEKIEVPKKPAEAPEVQPDKSAPKVLETNLIKGEIITFFDWRRKITAMTSAVLILGFFMALIYLGLGYYQKYNQAKIKAETKKFSQLSDRIRQEEAGLEEAMEFQARLKLVSQIFSRHAYWTNFFEFLENNTINNVYYTGFDGDTGGSYSLEAMASRFSDISDQINVFESNNKITEAQTAGGEFIRGDAGHKAGVKFNLSFSILKSIFTE